MSERNIFSPGQPVDLAIKQWWRGLQDRGGDRAALRRAQNANEVALQPAYYRLFLDLKKSIPWNGLETSLPYVAGLIAHVKSETQTPIARAMAGPQGGKVPVSDLRFRRLLKIDSQDELYPALIRVIRMLDSEANLLDLAASVFFWNDRTRKRWAFLYYAGEDFAQTEKSDSNEIQGAES